MHISCELWNPSENLSSSVYPYTRTVFPILENKVYHVFVHASQKIAWIRLIWATKCLFLLYCFFKDMYLKHEKTSSDIFLWRWEKLCPFLSDDQVLDLSSSCVFKISVYKETNVNVFVAFQLNFNLAWHGWLLVRTNT